MLSLNLRFMLQFCFIIPDIFGLITSDIPNQCKSAWHYLSEEKTCVMFATTQGGDVPWSDAYKACEEADSAELLTFSESTTIQSIEKKITDNQQYSNHIQRGAWIGKATWSNDDLCDSTSLTTEDPQLDCVILTKRLNNQSLCLERVSCEETHPFICQTPAMTEKDLEESTMDRGAWWHCLINVIWCAVEDANDAAEKKKQDAAAKAAADAEIQAYTGQFDFSIPDAIMTDANGQALMKPTVNKLALSDSESSHWLSMVAGGFIFLFLICMCCAAFICVCKKIKNGKAGDNSVNRNGSIDSTDSR